MEKNSTLFSPDSESFSVKVKLSEGKTNGQEYPKPATIRRICQFARAAFSDAALDGMPAIVLN